LIETIFSALFGLVCLCLLILKERERTKDKERHFVVEKELLDRIMSRDYGEYSAIQNPENPNESNGNNWTTSENETSIYLQALGEDLPPNLMSEYSTNKGDVDGR
tara:strand:+ start:188 stop:502 length:315 start_codon:yes stop_codon:yes gene_type:complete